MKFVFLVAFVLAVMGFAYLSHVPSVDLQHAAQYRDWVNHGLDTYEASGEGKLAPDIQDKDFSGVVGFLVKGNFISEAEGQEVLAFNRHTAPCDRLFIIRDSRSIFHSTSLPLENHERLDSLPS